MLELTRKLSKKISTLGKNPSQVWTIKATSTDDEPPRLKYIRRIFYKL